MWLLPVLITCLKTWRRGLPPTWQSDHLPGPSACNCTPPLLGPCFFFFTVPSTWEDFTVCTVSIYSPSQKIPTPMVSPPQTILLRRSRRKKKKISICTTADRRLQSSVTKFSVEKASSLLGCSGVFMTYASFGNPDLQRRASIWFGNQSTNYLAL